MPEKLSVNVRAIVTAGLAKLVEAVNQYPAVIYIATSIATASGDSAPPVRWLIPVQSWQPSRIDIDKRPERKVPTVEEPARQTSNAPEMYRKYRPRFGKEHKGQTVCSGPCPATSSPADGRIKNAPEIETKIVIKTYRMAPVAIVLPSKASPSFPPDRRSAIMPEPITVATRNKVPINSAASF